MKSLLIKTKHILPGVILGGIAGYLYYYFWGCTEGCTISSSPINSIIYGATMGGLLNSIVKKENNSKGKSQNQ
jgi:phage shock protein E